MECKITTGVYNIVKDHLALVGDFGLTETLSDIGADSLDHVEIIMEVEETFGVEIPDEDAQGLCTVQAIAAKVLAIQSK